MTGSSGLNIDISLQRMSDNSVQMVCNMQQTASDDAEVEGSGESRLSSSSSSFPSDLYLIKDVAVCNDLATAVGNDITTEAIKLAQVAGTGEATEAVAVTWSEVSASNCMAMLKQKPADEDDAEVIIEFRGSRTPRQVCRRRDSILTPYLNSRAFASLNLAGFALVSAGVTSKSWLGILLLILRSYFQSQVPSPLPPLLLLPKPHLRVRAMMKPTSKRSTCKTHSGPSPHL